MEGGRAGVKERLERGEDVRGDGSLVPRDGGGGRRRAEAGAERAVEEEEPEAAVPGEGLWESEAASGATR